MTSKMLCLLIHFSKRSGRFLLQLQTAALLLLLMPPSMPPLIPYTHEGDLEDMIADEVSHNKSTSEILIQDEKTTKAKALRHRMADHASGSSTDCLKCMQQLPCFNVANRMAETDIITTSDSPLGTPSLHVGNPVALLVRCEGLMVLAIAQVNQI